MFFQELINYVVDWYKCRQWRQIFWLSLPLSLVLIAFLGIIGFGYFGMSERALTKEYIDLAEAEMAATAPAELATPPDSANDESEALRVSDSLASSDSNSTNSALFEIQQISDFAAMLYRRVLQIEDNNNTAAFKLALDLSNKGRLGTARQLMRKIAPIETRGRDKSSGLSAAHAWLALEAALRLNDLSPEERKTLLRDFDLAMNWERVNPDLIRNYVELLIQTNEGDGQNGERAIALLVDRMKDFPELDIELVKTIWRLGGHENLLKSVMTDAKLRLAELVEGSESQSDNATVDSDELADSIPKDSSSKATVTDHADYASLLLATQEYDRALQVSKNALLKFDSPLVENANSDQLAIQRLRRVMSECYRFQYRLSMSEEQDGTHINLSLLDMALKADPTNPTAINEVAALVKEGREATPEMIETLRDELAEGRATAVAHLCLADWLIAEGQSEKAIPHLELALLEAKDHPVALNNLAYALALRGEEQDFRKALEMIERAIAISRSPDFLRTKGEILALKGDVSQAIICLQQAVRMDGSNISTRRELASAYEQLQMPELAAQQLQRIRELQNQQNEEKQTGS